MSDFSELEKLQCAVIGVCPLYIEGFFGSVLYVLTFYPFIITMSLFAISLYINEFYLFAVSMILTFNSALNYLLRLAFGVPAIYPGCGPTYGMPSMATQHAILFESIFVSFILIYKPQKSMMLMLFIKLFTSAVMFAWVYIGINSILELTVGAVIGLVEGMIFQRFMYWINKNHLYRILDTPIFKWMTIEDNLCNYIFKEDNETSIEERQWFIFVLFFSQ